MSESTTSATATTATAPALPAALDAATAGESDVVSAINSLIAYVAANPPAALTSQQNAAMAKVIDFFKIPA